MYLVNKFRSESTSLTQGLLDEVRSSWDFYVHSKVSKGLPSEEVPPLGSEWQAWSKLSIKAADSAWKNEALKRDEKFDMHFAAAVRSLACQPEPPSDAATIVPCLCSHSSSKRVSELRPDGCTVCSTTRG